MKKKRIIALGIAAVVLGAAVALGVFRGSPKPVADFKDATYQVDGVPTKLSTQGTQYFGNVAVGDVDGDGQADTAFIFTQSGGGSGTFYYATVALGKNGGWVGTNAILLGDRIAPQTTEIHAGVITVNYADRKAGEPMTATPTVATSKYFVVQAHILSEPSPPASVACTMEAKLCPDGSAVGRQGPHCEFAPCP